ncbi:hypothetical protein N9A28_03355 [Sulfurimonas sp.]|nr:hypothetical protein [Sulfurimonas sp.]
MENYSLKDILHTFTKSNGRHRLLYNKAPIGGLSSMSVALILYSLPFWIYLIIFKTAIFDVLGIATSIILYIISSSTVMITVFVVAIRAKSAVIKAIGESWNHYFKDVDLDMVLASTKTPYSDFFDYYSKVAKIEQSEKELHDYLLDSFKAMKEDNADLIEAMQRDNKLN